MSLINRRSVKKLRFLLRAYNYDNPKPVREKLDQLPAPTTPSAEIPSGNNVIATL